MIIVFGGFGFIARHFVARLSGRREVTLVARSRDDAFLRDHAPAARLMPLEAFDGPEGDALIASATAFVWLAGATVPSSNEAESWNELGLTLNPLWRGVDRTLSINPKIRFVFPSSAAVYGGGCDRPTPEDAPLKPISAYGLGKVMAENVIQWTARKADADYVILRVSNPVGRWQRNDRQGIASIALRALQHDRPVTLFGEGRQVRDFFDADDLAELLEIVATWPKPLRGVWNAGSGRAVTVAELVDLLGRSYGRAPEIIEAARRPQETDYSVVDTSRAARDFGWRATTSLGETIVRLVASAKNG